MTPAHHPKPPVPVTDVPPDLARIIVALANANADRDYDAARLKLPPQQA
jgi:hypothetical protein